jgi:hypothetical protein
VLDLWAWQPSYGRGQRFGLAEKCFKGDRTRDMATKGRFRLLSTTVGRVVGGTPDSPSRSSHRRSRSCSHLAPWPCRWPLRVKVLAALGDLAWFPRNMIVLRLVGMLSSHAASIIAKAKITARRPATVHACHSRLRNFEGMPEPSS